MNSRFLTSTGERRIYPKQISAGGIAVVTRIQTRRGREPKIHYSLMDKTTGKRISSGWMVLSLWGNLKRSHKKPPQQAKTAIRP